MVRCGAALARGLVLGLALAVAACGGRPGGRDEQFEPLRYDYLTPIGLNVAAVEVSPLPPPSAVADDATALDPVRPADAMAQMAHDRLQALGTSGRAVLTVEDATVLQHADSVEGSFAVELDIYTSANTRAAFAEARVSGRRSLGDGESVPHGLYALTKELMDQLNVELEFQVRRSLRDWLATAATPVTAPVQEQSLPPPVR